MNYDCVYVIGDSYAAGSDVKIDDNFASLIGKHLDIPVINKGYPGGSNFYILRKIYQDIPKLKADKKNPLVIVVYTQWAREEFFLYDLKDSIPGGLATLTSMPYIENDFIKKYYRESFDETYVFNKTLLYINAIQNLLKVHQINRVECFSMDHVNKVGYVKFYDIDHSCLMDIDLMEKGGKNKFFTEQDKKNNIGPNGHLTEVGNQIVADWLLEKIYNLYGNNTFSS